jgi:hypothetical protein
VTVNWRWLLALPVLVLIGYGFGRYASPAKVETVTKVETREVVKWQDRIVERKVEGPVRTVTRTLTREVPCTPGDTAPFTDTTTTVEEGPVVTDSTTDASGSVIGTTKVEQRTVTVYSQPRLMLQAGAAVGLDLKPAWNVGASYRLAGPFWLGVAYRSERQLELRASLSF